MQSDVPLLDTARLDTVLDERRPVLNELGFSEACIPKLREYLAYLGKKNSELNLVSRKMSMTELIDNHVIDCLLPLQYFTSLVSPTASPVARRIADFGSGGGLPSVIYALQFPDIQFRLFEKSPKKREFLEGCRKFASNIEVEGEIPNKLDKIDLVSARAFKPVGTILEMSRAHFETGGRYFLLKGRREKIETELSEARQTFKNLKAQILPLKSPVLENERNLVLIP